MKLRALLIACLLAWALPSFAGIPTPNCATPFNPVVESDAFAVCAPDGSLFAYTSVFESNEDPNAIYVVGGVAPNAAAFGFATTFCEAGYFPCGPNSPQAAFSDIYGVANANGQLVVGFSSDGDPGGSPYGNQGFFFIAEPNGWKDATFYIDPALAGQGYTAFFISQTPEPTTMLLLGSGIGLLARRLRKKT
jgi:hypothetical protein